MGQFKGNCVSVISEPLRRLVNILIISRKEDLVVKNDLVLKRKVRKVSLAYVAVLRSSREEFRGISVHVCAMIGKVEVGSKVCWL